MNTLTDTLASGLSERETAELKLAETFGGGNHYISGDELPWTPWIGAIEIKVMRVDNRTGQLVMALRSKDDVVLGKHRHRGAVTAVTLKGAWEYHEHDWIARPGDYVREDPGTIHTLHIMPGAEIIYTIDGSIEFLNEDDTLDYVMDVWSFLKLYEDFCGLQKIALNKNIFY